MSFKNISNRGRVAFLILCFERVLKRKEYSMTSWAWILSNLWSYTDCEFFDDWFELMAELKPSTIMAYSCYNDEFELLKENEFYNLRELYLKANNVVLEILESIINTGSVELFGGLAETGKETLSEMKKTISKLESFDIEFPRYCNLKRFSFEENEGWGAPFSREDFLRNVE